MPKMKTHSGAKKRFKLTASGKVKRKGANRNHIQAKKDQKVKKHQAGVLYVNEADEPRVKRMLIQGLRP